MVALNAETLRALAPRLTGHRRIRQGEIVEAAGAVLAATLEDYEIDTPFRIAHFLAQIAHESDGFQTTEEYASGEAYEGRADLGNTEAGDGRRYKGRGLIQLTGRANYRRLGEKIGRDLENDPELAEEPDLSLVIACEYWTDRKINEHADRDDLVAVTWAVNGGLNGLEDRMKYLVKARAEVARSLFGRPADFPVLRRGAKGPLAAHLQFALREAGVPVRIDGDFGPGTETALKRFQAARSLVADGIAGPAVWTKLPVLHQTFG
jgi:putative chitinase